MRRASYFARMLIVGGALIAGVTTQAYAGRAEAGALGAGGVHDGLVCSVVFLTPSRNPAVQPKFDLNYGIFNAGIFGPTPTMGKASRSTTMPTSRRTSGGIDFEIGGYEYTYPGSKRY